MPEYATEELQKARDAMSDAAVLRDGGATDEAIVNRLYYACFHAATAALYAIGKEPTSHRGTVALFGSELVIGGPATRADGRFLNRMRDYREQADYGYEPIEVDTSSLFERTSDFVDAMAQIVAERESDR